MPKIDELTKLLFVMKDAYKHRDFDACLAAANDILDIEPTDVSALRYAARIHVNRKEIEQAKPYWISLIKVSPSYAEPYLRLARVARSEGNWETCLEYLEVYLALEPKHIEAANIRFQCHLELKNSEKVTEAFAALFELDPDGILPLAQRAVQSGFGREIAGTIRAHADAGNADSIKFCEKMWHFERDAAIGYEIRKNPFKAMDCYQAMCIYDPNDNFALTGLTRLRKPFLKNARNAYADREFKQAIEYATTSIRIYGSEPDPYLIAGRAYMQLEQFNAAFEILQKAAKLFWDQSWLLINYARAAIKNGKSEVAFSVYLDVSKRDDELSLKYKTECETILQRLPKVAHREARILLVDSRILDVYQKFKMIRESGMENEETDKLEAKIKSAGVRKIRDLAKANDPSVMAYVKAHVQFDPKSEIALRTGGRFLIKDRSYEDAIFYWEALVEMDRTNIESLLNLGRCYHRLGNKDDARRIAHALLKLDPDHIEGKKILASSSSSVSSSA